MWNVKEIGQGILMELRSRYRNSGANSGLVQRDLKKKNRRTLSTESLRKKPVVASDWLTSEGLNSDPI
jgi:hypothetical protein